jgi:hypothetical protein
MKQKFFTLIMMLALVIMAGKAFAANETSVIPGGTYTYNLSDVYSFHAATATAIYSDGTATVTELTSSWTIAAATNSTVSFTIKYGTQAAPAVSGTITVSVSDNTSSCSNHITMSITVVAAPSFDLTIASSQSTPYCQTTATATNNTAATQNSLNTITYTVTRGAVTNPPSGGYTWGYTINIPNTTSTLGTYAVKIGATDITSSMPYTVTGLTSATTSQDITVTFYSTTGLNTQTLTGTESLGTVTDLGPGAAVYAETTSPEHYDVTIKSVPSIGTFH